MARAGLIQCARWKPGMYRPTKGGRAPTDWPSPCSGPGPGDWFRPYKPIDLANAAGMSISGIRTAYDTDEIDQATEILQRPPTTTPPQPVDDR